MTDTGSRSATCSSGVLGAAGAAGISAAGARPRNDARPSRDYDAMIPVALAVVLGLLPIVVLAGQLVRMAFYSCRPGSGRGCP